MGARLSTILNEVRGCEICRDELPLGPRPLVQGSSGSRLLVIGQAPGRVAHETGIPWKDRSGYRLRAWLGLGESAFYDAGLVALMPMGFCYPGTGRGGDLAPRRECAPEWHERIRGGLVNVGLTVYTGRYAFERYLGGRFRTISEASGAWERLLPGEVALPHPSPRNNLWLKKNPWFESEALPVIRARVRSLLG